MIGEQYTYYENGTYSVGYYTEEDVLWYKKGYDYFNSLETKRPKLEIEDNSGFTSDYGILSIQSYNNLPIGSRIMLVYGWEEARNLYIIENLKPFIKKFEKLKEEYKVDLALSSEHSNNININGVDFAFWGKPVI